MTLGRPGSLRPFSTGRNVYAQVGDEPGDGDVLIGQFDTASLAHDAIWWHNQAHGFTQTDGRADVADA